jgi:hypothetical protein
MSRHSRFSQFGQQIADQIVQQPAAPLPDGGKDQGYSSGGTQVKTDPVRTASLKKGTLGVFPVDYESVNGNTLPTTPATPLHDAHQAGYSCTGGARR